MRPAARVQAAIELLDTIVDCAKRKAAPADRIISEYFKARRYAGSKDRRAIRDLVYRAIRLCGPVPNTGRAAMLAVAQEDPTILELFDGSEHGPSKVRQGEKSAKTGIAPGWLIELLSQAGITGEAAQALLGRAPLDIRVNSLKADRDTIELPEPSEKLAAAQGLRFPFGTQVEQWPAYREGQIEVQDHGSQLVCEAITAKPGDTVIDLCAGAGGKTLALAAKLGNAVALVASDTDKRRLGNLAPRAARTGAQVDNIVLLDPGKEMEALANWTQQADHVLVDAPCSGSGTWRRNPESRWRLDEAELTRLNTLQDHVLDLGAQLVRPGGSMTFITCSVLNAEGSDRIAAFLERHQDWSASAPDLPLGTPHGPGIRLDPFQHGTDGFFVANLSRA